VSADPQAGAALTPALTLQPVGRVVSPVTRLDQAPRQGDEGAPVCAIDLDPAILAAAGDLIPGQQVILLTWLHVADRQTLQVHPRGDPNRPPLGVFSTRSADRPNPIGLHTVRVLHVSGGRLTVEGLEAIDGTPVIDIKPILGPIQAR